MLKIGVIGYGEWGPQLVRMFSQLSRSRVVSVCDLKNDNLALAKKRHPYINTVSSYTSLLNTAIDAVIVASSAMTHYQFVKDALKKGLHVLVEKPFVLDLFEAKELVKLAQKKKRVLMVGHILKYHPAVLYLKNYISSGEFGDIYYLYAQRLSLGRIRREEDVIWSFGPHDISTILYILNRFPEEVSVQGKSYLQKKICDVSFITLKFPNEILAHIHLSWLDPSKTRKLTIVGSKKMLVFDDMETAEKIRIFNKGVNVEKRCENFGELISLRNGDVNIPFLDSTEPLRNECEHFIDCVFSGKEPCSNGQDGINVLRILKAAQISLKNNGIQVRIK